MGKNTSIEWTDHTFNPWWGCEKVSPGCAHCYADTFAKRVGHGGSKPKLWGPDSERRMFGDKHWREPLKWDRKAEVSADIRAAAGWGPRPHRPRVFCASMADVFEDRPELAAPRARLFGLILATPNLDWLLLTKRPENADRLWRAAHRHDYEEWAGDDAGQPGPTWRPNVWLGTTVEDQQRADERIPHMLAVPAAVRFLSCEPLLGPVKLPLENIDTPLETIGGIDWVIAGGESGPGARPMHPKWARSLRDQCAAAGVPFLFKQWGEYAPWVDEDKFVRDGSETGRNAQPFVNLDGGRGTAWVTDGDGTIQNHAGDWRDGDSEILSRVGKKTAGRVLDGRTHDAFPEVSR